MCVVLVLLISTGCNYGIRLWLYFLNDTLKSLSLSHSLSLTHACTCTCTHTHTHTHIYKLMEPKNSKQTSETDFHLFYSLSGQVFLPVGTPITWTLHPLSFVHDVRRTRTGSSSVMSFVMRWLVDPLRLLPQYRPT